jgi:hypothetical protein
MTKKDYESIAATLADYMPMNTQDVDYNIFMGNWLDIVNNFVVNLERDNPNFQREIFFEACGLDKDGNVK